MRPPAPLLLGLALLAGPAAAATPITYYQDWFPGAQYAGLYVAQDRGLFQAEGLEVVIHPFAFGQNQQAELVGDPARAAISTIEGYILLQKRAQGADFRALAAVLQESPAGYLSLPGRGAASAHDFVGRRVGVHRYGDPLYRLFLRRAQVDPARVTMVFVDDDVGRLQRGEVDLMQGYAIEELVKLRQRVGPGAGFLSFKALGFDAYSQVIFTTAAQLDRHAGACRAFVRAVRAGWAYAMVHPDEAAASVRPRLPPGTDPGLLEAMLRATLPYVAGPGSAPLAPMGEAKWRGMEDAAVEMGLLTQAEKPAQFLVAPAP